jgi:hypothetical protein
MQASLCCVILIFFDVLFLKIKIIKTKRKSKKKSIFRID